jgi:mannose-6-phosphate isomerase-like protein (cupin superfamily)
MATIKKIEKPWGYEEILETNPKYTVKRLFMKMGQQCSYQYHEKKQETIIVLTGNLAIIMEDKKIIIKPGEVLTINPFEKHRMSAEESDCLYLECSTSDLDDVIRIDDKYGRV